MRTINAIKLLIQEDMKKRHVYSKSELRELFNEDTDTLNSTINRLISDGFLKRATRSIYVYAFSNYKGPTTVDQIAAKLRPGQLLYESFLSSASKWSLISQIPWAYDLATTGKSGCFDTAYGTIIFTHVNGKEVAPSDLIDRSDMGELPLATPRRTYLDMLKYNQGMDMLTEEYNKYHGGWDGTLHHVAIEDDDTWDFLDNDPDLPKPVVHIKPTL